MTELRRRQAASPDEGQVWGLPLAGTLRQRGGVLGINSMYPAYSHDTVPSSSYVPSQILSRFPSVTPWGSGERRDTNKSKPDTRTSPASTPTFVIRSLGMNWPPVTARSLHLLFYPFLPEKPRFWCGILRMPRDARMGVTLGKSRQ